MSQIRGKYTPLRHAILDCPAWRAMSMGARALYVAIRRRAHHDGSNNGKVRFSNRQAQRELGAKERYVTAWFRELRHYGFVALTSKGYLGGEGRGFASTWRVTELPTPDTQPTDDYLRWGGDLFAPPEKKTPSPTGGTPRPQRGGHSRPQRGGHSAKNSSKNPSPTGGTSLDISSHSEANGATGDASVAPVSGTRLLRAVLAPTTGGLRMKRTDLPPGSRGCPKQSRPLPVKEAASEGMPIAATCLQVPAEADRPLQRARVAPIGSQEYGPSAVVITPPVYIAPAGPSTEADSARLLREQIDAVDRRRRREMKLLSRKLNGRTVQ